MKLVKFLGADKVIDYTKEDFAQSGETYDLIFYILGKSSFSRCKNLVNQNGRYLLASFKMKQLFQMLWTSITGGRKVICALSFENPADLVFIKELIEAGKMKTIIDRRYPLEQIAEAHRYIETGHKNGNVVITMGHSKIS
jgi:NADPH:quinone reductase-like Zn-dependent oxidoreductase